MKNIFLKTLLVILPLTFCSSAFARDSRVERSILLSADEVIYNDDIQVVNAFGNVEIVRDNSVLWADEVTYNKAQDIIMAKGNITFKDEEGNVSYGSSMELNNKMKTGFIKSPQGVMTDDSKIAGSIGERESDTITTLKNAVYSPCEICEGDEDPIWQIKAKQVKSNEETMDISYKHAWLEIYGTPVFYTPYLTHPDPRVKRRSGWLPPTFENVSDVGFMFRNYYYWDIQENTDATIELTAIDLVDTPLLGAEVRHLFDTGELNLAGSMTINDTIDSQGEVQKIDVFQGHLFVDGKFDLDEHWTSGFALQGVTADNYFEYFDFDNKNNDMLTSKAYINGFYGNDYLALTGYKFTDLRPNIDSEQPEILPFAEYSFKGGDMMNSNYDWTFQGDILALNQDSVAKELRLYNQAGLEQNYLSSFGLGLDISADLYTRAYFLDQKDNTKDETIFEVMPQLSFLAKYPLSKTLESGNTAIIEPVANLLIAPNGANDEDVPLQDSTVLDLDYTNLFSKNRLSGVDRLEDGIRSSYGLKASVLNDEGGYSSLFLGQAYRKRANPYLFNEISGLGDKFSDIIVEIQLKPYDYLNLDYYALLDKDDFTDKKHEAYFSVGKDIFKVMGSYLYAKEERESTTNENLHELNLGFSSELNDYWKLSGASTSALGAAGDGLLKARLNLEYTDECFSFGLYGERDLTNRKGASSATTIMFKIGLKNIGEFHSPAVSADFLNSSNGEEE